MPYSYLTAQSVADFFLSTPDEEESRDDITPLKVQKLLYYAQGLHVAMHDEPLFPEDLEAWDNGPVVRSIWDRYRQYGKNPIDPPSDFDPSNYPPEIQELLGMVYATYGQFSPWKLRNMTHDEAPWKATARNDVITIPSLKAFFIQVVEAGKNRQAIAGEPIWPTNEFRFQNRRRLSARMAPMRAKLREIAAQSPRCDAWADEDEIA